MPPRSCSNFTDDDLSKIRPFRAASVTVNGENSYVARTGYTGEDGFEVMLRAEAAPDLWSGLADVGRIVLWTWGQGRP